MPRRQPARRRRLAQASVGLVGLGGLFAGMIGTGGPAAAEGNCENLPQYGAVASATGKQTVASAPGLTLVSQGDAGLPAAQAAFDSVLGSSAFAGAPYSEAVAGNAGAAKFDPNQVPVFAKSSHPTDPKASKALPAGTLSAESNADGSSGRATLGAPGSGGGTAANSDLNAKSSCAADTTIASEATTVVSGIDIGGVLKIASVRTRAKAVMSPTGDRKLEASVEITGATVGGRGVSITEKGLVLADSPPVLLADPVTPALKAAGISVRYIAKVEDSQAGQVMSPALEISFAQQVPGVGSGPIGVTQTYGRSLARVSSEPGAAALADDDVLTDDFSSFDGGSAFADVPASDVVPLSDTGGTGGTGVGAATRKSSGGGGEANLPTARIADWSIAPGYSAMGVGALLLLVAWVGLEKIAVRFRWR